MNETKKTVKTAFAFALVLALVVGTLFGVFPEVPDPVLEDTETVVENTETVVGDDSQTTVTPDEPTEAVKPETPTVETPAEDEPIVETPVTDVTDVETPVEDNSTEDEGVIDDATQDSTPADTDNEIVDDSADASVAEPTEENNTTATEGDTENA